MDRLEWLYLDLNSFFASVEQQLRPELRGRPVAVLPAMTEATCVIAASYEAKACGIKTGTRVYEARRLCPELVCVVGNHAHYAQFHHRILASVDRQIPVEHVESIDEVSCRLDASQRGEEAARALARRIKAQLAADIGPYVRCSIGIAPNRFLAKTASNLEKPDGLQVLYATDVPARLRHWEPAKLTGIGAGIERRLHRAGVFSMEQLYALSPRQLRAIWGSVQGERFWHLLRGVELPQEETTRRSIGHSHVLEPEGREAARAREVMQRLLQKAASRLRRMDYRAGRLSLGLRIEHGPKLGETVRFAPCCDTPALQREALALWDTLIARYQPKRLKKISVTLHGLLAAHAPDDGQMDLFDAAPPRPLRQSARRRERLSRAMDDLNARFGRDTVTFGGLPRRVRSFSGTRIAFTRIPDAEEFHE